MAYKKVLVGSTTETTARSSFLKCKLCICKPPSFRTLQHFGQTAEVKSQLGTGGIWNGKLSYFPHRPATDRLPFSSKVSPPAGSVKTGLAWCECPSVRDTVKTLQEGALPPALPRAQRPAVPSGCRLPQAPSQAALRQNASTEKLLCAGFPLSNSEGTILAHSRELISSSTDAGPQQFLYPSENHIKSISAQGGGAEQPPT